MTSTAMKQYIDGWRRRTVKEKEEAEALRRKALTDARRAVRLLVKDFGIKKAVLFGSVLVPGGFRRGSDIDLAVEGLASRSFMKACGRLMMEFDFEIDLKPLESLSGLILERVKKGEVVYERR